MIGAHSHNGCSLIIALFVELIVQVFNVSGVGGVWDVCVWETGVMERYPGCGRGSVANNFGFSTARGNCSDPTLAGWGTSVHLWLFVLAPMTVHPMPNAQCLTPNAPGVVADCTNQDLQDMDSKEVETHAPHFRIDVPRGEVKIAGFPVQLPAFNITRWLPCMHSDSHNSAALGVLLVPAPSKLMKPRRDHIFQDISIWGRVVYTSAYLLLLHTKSE